MQLHQSISIISFDNYEKIIFPQERLLDSLDGQRSVVLSLLQRGKELQRDPNCPEFVKSESRGLEAAWGQGNGRCADRLKALKEHLSVWREYKENKSNMVRLVTMNIHFMVIVVLLVT